MHMGDERKHCEDELNARPQRLHTYANARAECETEVSRGERLWLCGWLKMEQMPL